jgi:hypothetical protein
LAIEIGLIIFMGATFQRLMPKSLEQVGTTHPEMLALSARVGVGIMITHNPLHGSGQADFPHPALALAELSQLSTFEPVKCFGISRG